MCFKKVTLSCDFAKYYPIYFKCHVIINSFTTYCNTMNHNGCICIIGKYHMSSIIIQY